MAVFRGGMVLIGFVLAPQVGTFFYQAFQSNGWGVLIRPGVLIIGGVTFSPWGWV